MFIFHLMYYIFLAVSPWRAGGGSKTEQNERYGFASFSGLNVYFGFGAYLRICLMHD